MSTNSTPDRTALEAAVAAEQAANEAVVAAEAAYKVATDYGARK